MRKISNEILNPKNRGSIVEVDVGEAGEEYAKVFGANKNLARITPRLIDGLKPVQARTLYDFWLKKAYNGNTYKTESAVGDTMGRFHPHGDSSITEVINSMNQSWNWCVSLLTPDSSFGSIRGDDAAASRYTESYLSDFSKDCYFSDFKQSNVSMRRAYTDKEDEPEYLPAKYPIGIINPQLSSIGYGLASNIPPFNFTEVCKATAKLMDDPNAKIMLIPDSPTGADIIDNGEFGTINSTGKGKFVLQANYEIDYINNIITIKTLPMQVSCDQVQKKLIELYRKGDLPELVNFDERSKDDKVDFDIILTNDADPDKVIDLIMKKDTGLRKSYSCETRFVHDLKTKIYSPKEFILEWLDYRRDCVRSIYNEKIVNGIERLHTLEVIILITAPGKLKKTMDIVFKSKNKKEAIKELIHTYNITSVQAEVIAGMKVMDFTEDKREDYIVEQKELIKYVDHCQDILDSDNGIDEVIKEEFREGIKKWGYPRKSKIVKVNKVKDIPDTYHIIGISYDGYIKKLSLDKYSSIGCVGKVSKLFAISISNKDNLLLFDETGLVTRVSVSAIPDMKYDDIGIKLNRYFKSNGVIVSAIKESDVKEHSDSNIVMVTKNGYGKKTSLSEFKKIKVSTIGISLDDGDKLISAIPSLDGDDFIIYTNFGDGIRLHASDFKNYKKTAKGLSMITLRKNEEVRGIDMLYGDKKYILYITSMGKVKLTEERFFPSMKRKDEPLSLISLDDNEILLGVKGVSKKDTLICYKRKSGSVELPIKDIPVTTRVAKAEKMIKTPKGDDIVGYIVKS